MEEVTLEKKDPQEVCVYPLKKTRRALLYLADFFVSFFLSFALFHLAANPISAIILEQTGDYAEMEAAQRNRDSVLYGNGLLFAEENQEPSSFSNNIAYTSERYVAYLCGAEDDSSYDVLETYYIDIRNDSDAYMALFSSYDEEGEYFVISEGIASLRETYVEEWKPCFDPKDTISAKGSEDMDSFIESFFLPSYSRILSDIMEKDLTYQGVSYIENQTRFAALSDLEDLSISLSALASHLASCLICFLLIPCLSKNRKTISMMAMHIERVDANRLILLKRRDILIRFVFDFVSFAMGLFLIPLTAVDFNELFSLPFLFPVSLVAIVYTLASLAFLLMDSYGRTLSDRLTGTVLVDNETLDEIYRAKGYPI